MGRSESPSSYSAIAIQSTSTKKSFDQEFFVGKILIINSCTPAVAAKSLLRLPLNRRTIQIDNFFGAVQLHFRHPAIESLRKPIRYRPPREPDTRWAPG